MVSEYGKMLRKIRIDESEPLNVMAEKLGVSTAFLSYVENGKREIPSGFTEKIGDQYRLDFKVLRKLYECEVACRKTYKIEIDEKMDVKRKQTVVLLANRLEKLDDGKVDAILKVLEVH